MSMQTDKPAPDGRPRPDARDPFSRFFGGSPLGVVFRLALLSILVGLALFVSGAIYFRRAEGQFADFI